MKQAVTRTLMAALVLVLVGAVLPKAATDLPLPPAVARALQGARTPDQVAKVAAGQPDLAATIMAEAAALGIAAPSAVVVILVRPALTCADLLPQVVSAAEAAPLVADLTSQAAFRAAGKELAPCALATIATAAIDGIEAANITADERTAEAREIALALSQLAPGSEADIATAVAAATDTPSDTAESILAAIDAGIETADVRPRGLARAQIVTPIDLFDLPNSARDKASPN